MCQAFSALVTKSKKVYWKTGVDSHDELQVMYVKKDKELKDDKEPPNNTFARIEIAPKNRDYLNPDKWIYNIDERVKPKWLKKSYEKPCREAWKLWKEEVYSLIDLEGLKNLIHPFKITPPKKITKKHLNLLRQWDSVWDSVRGSVWDSVRDSVRDSVGGSVWDSVRDSVWDSVRGSVWDSVRDSVGDSVGGSVGGSVRDSVWAYTGSHFEIKKWRYTDKIKIKGYPFQSVVKLWKMGLVPSYDGKVWRLHGGKKANILWEGKI